MLLLAFLLYGGGSLLANSVTGEPVVLADVLGSEGRLGAGVLLMLLNCVVVIVIGIAAYPVLRRHHPLTATAYLPTRGFEAALLAVSSVLLLGSYTDADAPRPPRRWSGSVRAPAHGTPALHLNAAEIFGGRSSTGVWGCRHPLAPPPHRSLSL